MAIPLRGSKVDGELATAGLEDRLVVSAVAGWPAWKAHDALIAATDGRLPDQ